MYNDILRIRTICVATMLSRNSGVVLPALLLYRISTRYTRCQATLVRTLRKPWRTVTNILKYKLVYFIKVIIVEFNS